MWDLTMLVCLSLFVLTIALYLLMMHGFLSDLRTKHPAIWKDLGEPKLFNATPLAAMGVVRFVWRSASAASSEVDPDIRSQARSLKLLLIVGIAAGTIALIGDPILRFIAT